MNSYILWNPSYSVGNPVLDQQHRTVIRLINQLFLLIEEGTFDGSDPIIAEIARYTKVHFSFEENLLRNAGYPALDSHLALHRKMVEQTALLELNPPRNEETARNLLGFLKEWWLDHIVLEDGRYIPFVGKLSPR